MLALTVDVEEDMPNWRITDPITVSNVQALPRLAELCSRHGARPTYLCTYPAVTQASSAAILRDLHERGDCEIGTHLHAWNTPPFHAVPGRKGDERGHTYYQFELGAEQFRSKLVVLHAAITDLTGTPPLSFRAGRFGIDAATLRELIPLGYEVDSSVTPLSEDRADRGPDFRSAPQYPYRPSHDDVGKRGSPQIIEIPVSVGLTRRLPAALQNAYVRLPKITHMRGLLSRDYLGLVDFAWLYPARFDLDLMLGAARTLVAGGAPILNIFLHSSELVHGQSLRVHDRASVEQVFKRLDGLLAACLREFDAEPCTLIEAGCRLQPGLGIAALRLRTSPNVTVPGSFAGTVPGSIPTPLVPGSFAAHRYVQ